MMSFFQLFLSELNLKFNELIKKKRILLLDF